MNRRRVAVLSVFFALTALALAAPPSSALEIKQMTLSNGAILLVAEQHQLPMVTMAIAFDAGSRRDPAGKEGIANLTASCLTLGTQSLSAAQFNQKVDFMGSSVTVAASQDFAEASLTSLKKYEGDTLKLLAGILQHPALHDDDIVRKRAEVMAAIKAAQEQPGYVAGVTFRKQLFGSGPYGHPPEGFADTVAKLTPDDVRSFYKQYYKMGSAVIAVVGDVDANQIKTELEKELSGPSGTVKPQPVPSPLKVASGVHLKLVDRNVSQANIVMGFPGVERSNPDFYRLQVMNYILGGGGFASRLMQVVRTQSGLAYSIGSTFEAGKFPGAFRIVLQTKNASSNKALRLSIEQLKLMRTQAPANAQMASAKKFLIGSFPLKLDRQSALANFMLALQLYHLGLNYAEQYPKYINGVTGQNVLEVARMYLHPDAMIVVAVANQSKASINAKELQEEAKPQASPTAQPTPTS
ncbi:MAG: M16 family metallopeptidase [Candidatus Binataceae bacterium]